MSPTDDDLRAGLARAAQAVSAPEDPVGRVRAAVDRRRRRRQAVRLGAASAVTAGVLVAGVVVGSGELTTDAAPPATAPTADTGPEVGSLMSPEGLPGLALGEAMDVPEADLRPTDSGCDGLQTQEVSTTAVGPASMGATEVIAWLRDGVLVSVWVTVFPDRVQVPGDVPRTWLGPTLRSPLSAALELPGARLVKDDPLGDAAPAVSNVVVDAGDGVELVYSDVPVGDQPSGGRVTTLVLRTEAGRGCGLSPAEVTVMPGQGTPEQEGTIALSATGTDAVRLGGSVGAALAEGALAAGPVPPPGEPEPSGDPLDGRGCTSYTDPVTGLGVWADGDTVVGIGSVPGGLRFELAAEQEVRSGQPLSELESRPGAVPVRAPLSSIGTAVDLQVAAGVRARVSGYEQLVLAETTGVLVPGPPLVDAVLLYEGEGPADSLCSS